MKKNLHCSLGYGKLAIARAEKFRPGWVTKRNFPTSSTLLFFFIFFFFSFKNAHAQSYNMSNTDVTTCSGNFYDSGGSSLSFSGRYQNNENYNKTFTPSVPGNKIKVVFTTFTTEANYDGLMIYDGNSTAAPLISSGAAVGNNSTTCPAGAYSGTNSPGTVTSTAADGSLTFVFRSDGGTRGGGWIATISCEAPATAPPDCASGFSPADGAANIARNTALSWSAVSGATSYDVYFGTSPSPALLANVTDTSFTPPSALAANTTYYYRIVPKNAIGAASGCTTNSFMTGSGFSYCSSITFSIDVEPITLVNFADINNSSSATVNGTPALQDFSAIVGNVMQGSTYTLTLKGNTAGPYTNNYRAFIDWNQDGDFDDAGETIDAGSINSSTGTDSDTAVTNITVPTDAVTGSTRMRIKKLYSSDSGDVENPCTGGQYGQIEDYTLNISENNLPDTECASLTSPANGATNVAVSGNAVTLTWTASATGPEATSFDVYIGTDSGNLQFVGNVPTASANVTGVAVGTTYYWRIVSKADGANDSSDCETFSFTTANPFLPYCYSNVTYSSDVEPITSVSFADIANTSSATINGSGALEDFISITANVTTQESYTLTLKGNTGGNYTNYFRAFIDWNQDGDFSDAGESIDAGSINNSTGVDSKVATSTITVPADALQGITRMRIKKIYSFSTPSSWDACTGASYGQSEDYSINVTLCTPTLWYADADSDGYGNPDTVVSACHAPEGYVADGTDCDDNDETVHQSGTFYIDVDNDGYDAGQQTICYGDSIPSGYNTTSQGSDCDDENENVHPFAAEIGYNLIDDDCDGLVDEGFPLKNTTITTAQCDTTLPEIDSYLIADLVAGAQGYQWRITTMSGPDTGQVQFLNTPLRVMRLTQLGTYAFDTTYKVEVAVYFAGFLQPYLESDCTVTTPVALSNLIACPQAEIISLSDPIYATNVPYATGYRFRITDSTSPTNTQTLDRPLREFRMSQITAFQVQFNKVYNVEVAVRNIDGNYLPFNETVCTVLTPLFPTTSLNEAQCDNFLAPSDDTLIYADSYPGAIAYVFNLSGNGLPAQGIEVTHATRAFKLSDFSGLTAGATYNVRVRLIFNYADAPGAYGKVCTVTVPGLSRLVPKAFDAVLSPNPFGSHFGINVNASAKTAIAIKIYDMTGRLLDSLATNAAELAEKQLGENYPSGIYNIVVSSGDDVVVLRAIKR